MLEQKLTGWRRGIWLAAAIVSLAFAVWFGTLAVTLPPQFPLWGRLGFASGAVFSVLWAVLGIRVFRRGSLNLKIDTATVAGLSWVFPVLLVTFMLVGAPDNLTGLRMIASGLVCLIMGAVFLIGGMVQQAELRTRERMLQIEYRLAGLAEALGTPNSEPPRA